MFASWILATGAGGVGTSTLLSGSLPLLTFCWRYLSTLRAWSATRLTMTHELIEDMVGHRTRLAQEWPSRRDAAEDRQCRLTCCCPASWTTRSRADSGRRRRRLVRRLPF